MRKTASIAFALLALSTAAQAHQIWIEQAPGQNAQVRFGEFGESLREASPGPLDTLGLPTATLISGKTEKAGDGVKTSNGFTLPFTAAQGDTVVAEAANYPLYKVKRGDHEATNWYFPSARLVTDFAQQSPRLALDLVPAGKHGEFQLFFRGKPLPKAKVSLMTQSGWAREKSTDEQGKVAFDLPWKGTYVAEVSHDEQVPGERRGASGPETYHGVAFVTSVTYVKPEGVEPVAAVRAEKAGK
jgi:hypothetical protein